MPTMTYRLDNSECALCQPTWVALCRDLIRAAKPCGLVEFAGFSNPDDFHRTFCLVFSAADTTSMQDFIIRADSLLQKAPQRLQVTSWLQDSSRLL